jgi:3-hydroxybutyrate dehydrogenase
MTQGLNAVITGSTSGIGQGIAEAFAAAGINVMLNGFGDPGEIEALRARLAETHGVTVAFHGADMTKPDEISDLMTRASADVGEIDVVVNNAGIQNVAPIEEFPIEKWNEIIAINLSSAFHTTRLAIPGMKARGFGRIINTASVHGLVASPYKTAYNAAKHGIIGLTKTVALEVATSGITANAICPGFVMTPLAEKQIPEIAATTGQSEEDVVRDMLESNQPTRRFVTVEEIGALAVFLCTAAAASITGTSLPIDGGWTAR